MQPTTHLWGTEGGGVVSTCMRDDERAGSVQPATHSISVKGGNPEVIKRHSRANQSSSELMSDSLDLGARRPDEGGNQIQSATHSISARVGLMREAIRSNQRLTRSRRASA